MTKVCLGVDAYECFFFQSKENAGADENHPSINGTALQATNKLFYQQHRSFAGLKVYCRCHWSIGISLYNNSFHLSCHDPTLQSVYLSEGQQVC